MVRLGLAMDWPGEMEQEGKGNAINEWGEVKEEDRLQKKGENKEAGTSWKKLGSPEGSRQPQKSQPLEEKREKL